tara:strand:- start:1053 stop:1298 length:246 start_codon:yes stop_codon:yes gene_type:complete
MEDKQKNEWQEREIGALWKNEGRNQTYLTGKVGDQKVVIFSNRNKNKDNQPDFRVYKSEPKGQETAAATSNNSADTEEDLI